MRYVPLALLLLPSATAAQTVVKLPPPKSFSLASGPSNPNATTLAAAPKGETSREAPVNGVLTLYGDQRCPTDASGNEVVVCVRRGAAEQFRIPKELRELKVTPQNESWAKNQAVTLAAGRDGIGQCSNVGPGAGTGCLGQTTRTARQEAKERSKDATPDLSGY